MSKRSMGLMAAALLILPAAVHAQTIGAQTIGTQTRRSQANLERYQAEAAALPPMTVMAKAAQPGDSLSDPRLFLVKTSGETLPMRPKGTVQTAIEHRFSSEKDKAVTGALGYLCGLAPGPNEAGGVASSHEPMGTFLGGQLHVAF